MSAEARATDWGNMDLVGGSRFQGSLKGNNVNSRGSNPRLEFRVRRRSSHLEYAVDLDSPVQRQTGASYGCTGRDTRIAENVSKKLRTSVCVPAPADGRYWRR